ncbi:HD domain-containing protein [Paenibacillus sp. UNC451MF]|uniref:HD domain-containing protein n=1 Tax=Paenibacillus sp. UNC451MF TaxID=1449063 RepID=UPI00048F3BB2
MEFIIDRAIEFAARAHQGQVRKGTDIPYISHPYAVGMILREARCKPEVVAAGILHDTLEDTAATYDDLVRLFGQQVADIVKGCSEPDKSLSWEERKEHTVQYLKTAPKAIRMVACADKLHNVRSTLRAIEIEGDLVWRRFKRGKEQQTWYYRQLIESLGYESGFPLLTMLEKEVETLFGSERAHGIHRSDLDAKSIDALFLSVYQPAGEVSEQAEQLSIQWLLDEVLTLRDRIRNEKEPFQAMAEYLVERGIQFEQSEGSELLIAFCAALKQRLGLYNYEVYEHLQRNLRKGSFR